MCKLNIKTYCIYVTGDCYTEEFEDFSSFIREYNELVDQGNGFISYAILEDGTKLNLD